MNLEETAASLSDQFGELANISRKCESFFTVLGKIGFGGFGAAVVIGVLWLIYTIVTKMIIGGTQPLFGLLLVLFFVFAALTLVYVIYNEATNDKKVERRATTIPEFKAPDTGRLLTDPIDEPVPSVIENTTELLKVESQTRKLQ